MKDLPMGELAIWLNKRGTAILFYLFEVAPGRKYMRILGTDGGEPCIEIGVVNDNWKVTTTKIQTIENPYPVYNRVLRQGKEAVTHCNQ